MKNSLVQSVMVAVITCVISILGTVAMSKANTMTRAEVQELVQQSESRVSVKMAEFQVKQEQMIAKLENIAVDQAAFSAKLDTMLVAQRRGVN